MRVGLLSLCVLIAVAVATMDATRATADDVKPRLVQSYDAPAGDPLGDRLRGRAWTYDSAADRDRGARSTGDLDGAGALLDALQDVQRPTARSRAPTTSPAPTAAGPLRSGNQAWAGLAALQWRALTCSGRHDRLLTGLARWLLAHRIDDPRSPGFGLVRGGPDVTWASTEHNLETRAFFAGLDAALSGRAIDPAAAPCPPGLDGLSPAATHTLRREVHDAVARLDRAIDAELFVRDGDGRAHFGQGLDDDTRPLDVQALGILWLVGRGRARRRPCGRALHRQDDARPRPPRRLARSVREDVHRLSPVRRACGPDVLWMEGTLAMRLAKARLGSAVAALDRSADRWAALTAPRAPLQVDHAGGEDYHVWPAAAPAAWLVISRSSFALLQ